MSDDIYSKSVTTNDFNTVTSSGGVIKFVVPFWNNILDQARVLLPPDPPAYWSIERDIILRSSIHNEAFWAGAIGIALTKAASKGWEVTSPISLRARRAQELLLEADGRQVGWVGFVSKQLRDFLTTDNGSFFEIVREKASLNSRIIGLRHLDSLRCVRTGDPARPVIFKDRYGRYHVMRDYQVVALSDMPDPGETWYGVGFCAASRAYAAIYKLATIEWYLREKIGGLHPLSIYIVNGLLTNEINDAVKSNQEDLISKRTTSYMGATIIGIQKDVTPEMVEIPMAQLPDRFNRKEEFDISVLTYANALGLDVQDLQPLTGQALGTGAQSQVLDDKQKGKGLAAWQQAFPHHVNNFVLDDMTTFAFIEKDYRDQERQASVQKARAEVSKTRVDAGITSAEEEKQVLVDAGDLPKEFIPEDVTPGEKIDDMDKPEQLDANQETTDDDDADQEEAPKVWGRKEAQGNVDKSAMVAVFIPGEIARKIAVKDGNVPEDLHITLVYLGDEYAETGDREAIEHVLHHIASEHDPINGVINGRGTFELPDGANAHFLTLDSPGLPALRQHIIDALKDADIPVVENHGFVSHITLTYSSDKTPPDVTLPKEAIHIPALVLAWGNERSAFPFIGERLKASDKSLQEADELIARVLEKSRKIAQEKA